MGVSFLTTSSCGSLIDGVGDLLVVDIINTLAAASSVAIHHEKK